MMSVSKSAGAAACAALAALSVLVERSEARTSSGTGQGGAVIVEGKAHVIDGDTLVIAGQSIRLEGIDAPEFKQLCTKTGVGGGIWPAGRVATATLQRWVRGADVRCRVVGRGRYGRLLGRCATAGVDLNAAMIRHGLAWAFLKYSQTFVADELRARAAGVGVWSASCQTAWDYRANRWRDVADRAPAGCAIKGNVSRKGRIYHMPWGNWYGRTRIDTTKGERWFCNEAEAISAGWRPAVVR